METYSEKIKNHDVKPIRSETISEIKKQIAEMKLKIEAVTPINETHAKAKENGLIAITKFETDNPEFWGKIQYLYNVEKFGFDINMLIQSAMLNRI